MCRSVWRKLGWAAEREKEKQSSNTCTICKTGYRNISFDTKFYIGPNVKHLGWKIGTLLILHYLVGVKESPTNTKTFTIWHRRIRKASYSSGAAHLLTRWSKLIWYFIEVELAWGVIFLSPCHFWIRFCQLNFYQKFPNFFGGENWHQSDYFDTLLSSLSLIKSVLMWR